LWLLGVPLPIIIVLALFLASLDDALIILCATRGRVRRPQKTNWSGWIWAGMPGL
jgi:hypothetical protein